jgi:chaperonin cofactor prefoldin
MGLRRKPCSDERRRETPGRKPKVGNAMSNDEIQAKIDELEDEKAEIEKQIDRYESMIRLARMQGNFQEATFYQTRLNSFIEQRDRIQDQIDYLFDLPMEDD